MTYAERRAAAITMAAQYEGWNMPPTPEGNRFPPRLVPAWQAAKIADKRYIAAPGTKLYGFIRVAWNARTHAYFEAKQKNQNRRFDL